jgi:hypothetical protein
LNGSGTKLDREIVEIKQAISTSGSPGTVVEKIDTLTAEFAALTSRVDRGVARLQTYYDNGATNIRTEIVNIQTQVDQKWMVLQTIVQNLNLQVYELKNGMDGLAASGGTTGG